MIRSMTGFGSATTTWEGRIVTVEVRSVNSRGLKTVVKGPPGTDLWEADLRAVVEPRVRRGRVDVFVRLEEEGGSGPSFLPDLERARAILEGLERIRGQLDLPDPPGLGMIVQVGGVFRERQPAADAGVPADVLARTAAEALNGLVEMREIEGARLEIDLRERLTALGAGLEAAERLAPERLDRERERLRSAVAELTARGLDEDRLAREIALVADRWDVGEELVRARSHLEAFGEYLDRPGEEPVGKRLGFLVQELQREVNTLGAKANDTRISRIVVEMKNEIERLREQVENVE